MTDQSCVMSASLWTKYNTKHCRNTVSIGLILYLHTSGEPTASSRWTSWCRKGNHTLLEIGLVWLELFMLSHQEWVKLVLRSTVSTFLKLLMATWLIEALCLSSNYINPAFKWPCTVQKYLNNRTCYNKIICTILFSSRWQVCWMNYLVFYVCWKNVKISTKRQDISCLFVELFIRSHHKIQPLMVSHKNWIFIMCFCCSAWSNCQALVTLCLHFLQVVKKSAEALFQIVLVLEALKLGAWTHVCIVHNTVHFIAMLTEGATSNERQCDTKR